MTSAATLDLAAEQRAIVAALEANADPSYREGMRRTVPSQQQAHAVRVPLIRKVALEWSRQHKGVTPADVRALAGALWQTGWREERIVAMALVGRRRDVLASLEWLLIEQWSAGIDNWEHVDNMASLLSGPVLIARPELAPRLESLVTSPHVWQRRLAVVSLIEAVRDDPAWLPELKAMMARLRGDRGPTMRKALDWARRTAQKVEAR
jgi:3-methyladenine DNA glycosylase AlkD